MQSSSHDLSTPVADSVYVNTYFKNIFAYIEKTDNSGIRHWPDVKLLVSLATLKSCDTTKQSVCGWQYIYIYIYIYMRCCLSKTTTGIEYDKRLSWCGDPTGSGPFLGSSVPYLSSIVIPPLRRHRALFPLYLKGFGAAWLGRASWIQGMYFCHYPARMLVFPAVARWRRTSLFISKRQSLSPKSQEIVRKQLLK